MEQKNPRQQKLLGQGSFGSVYALPQNMARKVFNPLPREKLGLAIREIGLGHYLHHPNIMPIQKVELKKEGEDFLPSFIMRQGQDMINMEKLTPTQLAVFLWQSVCGLRRLHQAGFLHTDVKPDNMIFTPSGLFLTDLGGSIPVALVKKPLLWGTKGFYRHQNGLDQAGDWFALFVSISEILLKYANWRPIHITEAPGIFAVWEESANEDRWVFLDEFLVNEFEEYLLEYQRALLPIWEWVWPKVSDWERKRFRSEWPLELANVIAQTLPEDIVLALECPLVQVDQPLTKSLEDLDALAPDDRSRVNFVTLLAEAIARNAVAPEALKQMARERPAVLQYSNKQQT